MMPLGFCLLEQFPNLLMVQREVKGLPAPLCLIVLLEQWLTGAWLIQAKNLYLHLLRGSESCLRLEG